MYGLRAQSAQVQQSVTQYKVKLMELTKEQGSAQADMARISREAKGLETAIGADSGRIEEAKRQFSELQSSVSTLDETIDVERKDIDDMTEQLHLMENQRSEQITALNDLRAQRDSAASELTDRRDRKYRAELSKNRSELELKNMQDRIWEDYELTYENALPLRRPIAVTASHVRIDELKKSMRELGDVNLSAIEDYRNVKERFDSLSEQYQDLTKAEMDLTRLIGELVATMEEEFKRQFTLIQQNFACVFSELFGGGRAELILSDSNDILNCDIDIIAQPPGKKLQMLSLLSGGERALTAIALLFSILKLKPTAFCILDEIESSLDEVNVSNFAEYVKGYSGDTQFILITHRKGSMEVCDSLYGVAMEEKGISKVISARFNEIA